MLNLAALARLGTVTLSPQGTILLNNHAIPDLTISQVSGLDQIMELRNDSPDQGTIPTLNLIAATNEDHSVVSSVVAW